MTLPFLHRSAAGLYVAEKAVYWVDLHLSYGRIQRVGCTAEPIADGDVQGALRRLGARCAASAVAAHLAPELVRVAVRQGPAGRDEGSFAAWLQAQVAAELPAGAPTEDFAAHAAVLDAADEQSTCLVAVARRAAVETAAAGLRAAGLRPIRFGCPEAEVGHLLAYHDGFAEGNGAVLVVHPSGACLATYREGLLRELRVFASGVEQPLALSDEVEQTLTADGAFPSQDAVRLFVVGEGAEAVGTLLAGRRVPGTTVVAPSVALGRPAAPVIVPAAYVVPASLAMRLLFPALDAVNLLGGGEEAAWRDGLERGDAARILLGGGFVVVGLLLVASMAGLFLKGRRAEMEEAEAHLHGRVVEVERARDTLARLEADVRQAEVLVTERTDVAALLEQVGRAVPDSLWLRSVGLAPDASGVVRLTLEGAAFDGGPLAAYLDRLERAAPLSEVRLIESRAVSAHVLYPDLPEGRYTFTRFKIVSRVVARGGGSDA